ncbi:ATPase inhibitor subunit zeta [Tropicimonas aquimaris]|uniref:ATPase inhibitor subunit zeta n=1 Tax=Tropicimonas aquimaris TaxID=914152 RepID=A0ABW3IXB1_9RHOB
MSAFKKREQSMEAKFARDGELAFQARIQAFRFIAGWAAQLKDDALSGERELVQELIREGLRSPGNDRTIAVLSNYLGDLADEALLHRKLEEFMRDATAVVGLARAS